MASQRRKTKVRDDDLLSMEEALSGTALRGLDSLLASYVDPRPHSGYETYPGVLSTPGRVIGPELVTTPAAVTGPPPDSTSETLTTAEGDRTSGYVSTPEPVVIPGPESAPEYETTPGYETTTGALTHPATFSTPEALTAPDVLSSPAPLRSPGLVRSSGLVGSAGEGTAPGVVSSLSASRALDLGRRKIKFARCRTVQDGHSLGEQAIYDVMWNLGTPEVPGDTYAARTVRIGAADISRKVKMNPKNVRINITRLYEKLAIEVIDSYQAHTQQARMYRVFSYRQILEKRRLAGLEYVFRNKGVVFCTANGEEVVTASGYETTPGVDTAPEVDKATALRPVAKRKQNAPNADLQSITEHLNKWWSVDQAACTMMLRLCRDARPDVTIEEIKYLIDEKARLAHNNPKYVNPTGFLVYSVPPSCEGSAFDEIRAKLAAKQAREGREAEEKEVRRREEEASWRRMCQSNIERCTEVLANPDTKPDQRARAERELNEAECFLKTLSEEEELT